MFGERVHEGRDFWPFGWPWYLADNCCDYLRLSVSHGRIHPSLRNLKMNRRPSRRFKIISTAKLMLAVMLLVGFLCSVAPLAPVSAGSMCRLECCAGRAPHAAGSCMDGACESPQRTRPKAAGNRQAKRAYREQFCGLSHAVVLKDLARIRANHALRQVGSDQTGASATAFVKPCQPNCGPCASGFTNPNRQKNSAAIADTVRPRGPIAIHFSNSGYHLTQILKARCRQCGPRGPPVSFS